jgi:hypothetical protein
MLADLRYVLRSLRKSPGFAAVTVLSLVRSLPMRHPEQLVGVFQVDAEGIAHYFTAERLARDAARWMSITGIPNGPALGSVSDWLGTGPRPSAAGAAVTVRRSWGGSAGGRGPITSCYGTC